MSDEEQDAQREAEFEQLRREMKELAWEPESELQPQEDQTAIAASAVPSEMIVTADALDGARYLETYRDTNLFQLADGRIYLDGLIALETIEHARATLDHLGNQQGDGAQP